jgi:hypothetical protein
MVPFGPPHWKSPGLRKVTLSQVTHPSRKACVDLFTNADIEILASFTPTQYDSEVLSSHKGSPRALQ